MIPIIYNGSKIGETDRYMRIGETLELRGMVYEVVAVDYYEDPMVLVRTYYPGYR